MESAARLFREAVKVLKAVAARYGHTFEFQAADVGGHAIDKVGCPSGRDPHDCQTKRCGVTRRRRRPEMGRDWTIAFAPSGPCSALREQLGLYANLRPAKLYPMLADASTLRRDVIEGIDMLVIRELTGGIYFGKPKGIEPLPGGGERGINTEVYTTEEIRRIAVVAFDAARKRRKKVMSVDKANVLESSELWRRVVTEVQKATPT